MGCYQLRRVSYVKVVELDSGLVDFEEKKGKNILLGLGCEV